LLTSDTDAQIADLRLCVKLSRGVLCPEGINLFWTRIVSLPEIAADLVAESPAPQKRADFNNSLIVKIT